MSAPTPAVSVILPTYNRATLLCDALQSVLEQTKPDFELIVVDDGSTDETPELLREVVAADDRVRIFFKENGGTASARNHGLAQVRAPWVAFLDSDDIWLPEYLASQLAFAEAHPRADAVLCDALRSGGWKEDGQTVFGRKRRRSPDSLDAMCNGAWALPSCLLLRTEVAQTLGYADDFKQSEDTEFMFRFNADGHVLVENPEVLVVYRKHAQAGVEPQKVENRRAILLDNIRLLERYADQAGDPKKMRYMIDRRRALLLTGEGRWAEARPYLWRWYKHKPDSTRALRFFIRSLFARRRRASE